MRPLKMSTAALRRFLPFLHTLAAMVSCCMAAEKSAPPEVPDYYTSEVERCRKLLSSAVPEFRLEGIEGLNWLRHWQSEEALLRLTRDDDDLVRREATHALTRLGTSRSVPRLIELLSDERHEIAQLAHLGLQRMTGQHFAMSRPNEWRDWWQTADRTAKVGELLEAAKEPTRRSATLTALRHMAEPEDEERLLQFVLSPQNPPLRGDEWTLAFEVLERLGGETSKPHLLKAAALAPAAYALGRLGGDDAEVALLKARKSEAVWINLDRLHSAKCGQFAAELLNSFGLVSYRSTPDDVHLERPRPLQQVAANLLLRSGEAPKLVDLLLSELEGKSKAESAPEPLKKLLVDMRPELRPGFQRDDGYAKSMPLGALPHLAKDATLVPRLLASLDHAAVVPRVYAALTLGHMRAEEAVPKLLAKIEEPYPFSDSTALASGKHFQHSQTVRWKGFFCMALGRIGSETARAALEDLATDAERPRDVRYGALVGLGFIGSPRSLPTLTEAAEEDVIFMNRQTAAEAIREIELRQREAAAP